MGDHMKEWEVYRSLRRKFVLIWLSSVPVFLLTSSRLSAWGSAKDQA
jgi:hypothetical protein